MEWKSVKVWEEETVIPTYKAEAPEKNPLFLENRAYQGSTGKVYPFPVTEKISDVKEDVVYRAVYLENRYLKLMILPSLGGRIQRALDKTNGYDFVYYNRVIKPALVGLTGSWISGGIEFNWPQHHRPSTDLPVDYKLQENPDGSATVFISEVDRMYGTKGMAAFTLYPDLAYLEIRGQLYNKTDLPQTFLWWANPAVHVNEHTYSVFPPDVRAVMDHGKRAVSTFPIATGEYYKVDYSEGVDISCYRNVPVPTSYMAAHSDYDFIGNFDEKKKAGLLHVADHHISPGKKQWTWGNADFGKAWDRNLTDEDGPYIELMTGVFADNQPDFTWLKPYEEKRFVQYFMPYKQVGRVKNATKDGAVSMFLKEDGIRISLYTTKKQKNVRILLCDGEETVWETCAEVSPVQPFETVVEYPVTSLTGYRVEAYDGEGRLLVSYAEKEAVLEPVPEPASVLPDPGDIATTEELYLAGEHLEQYRHATYKPEDYYLEGLKRDPNDLRLNNRMGLLLYRRGRFEEAASHFRRAIERQTMLTPNPYSGECYFNLGLALEALGDDEAAFDACYKSTWSSETQSGGFYRLALLSAKKKDWEAALEFAERSLVRNWHNMNARLIKAAVLRRAGKNRSEFLHECKRIDPLYMGILFEEAKESGRFEGWKNVMRDPVHNYLELSSEYLRAGLYEEALEVLSFCEDPSPMLWYYKGYALFCLGKTEEAKASFLLGESAPSAWCFPNRVEEIRILSLAIGILESAPHAEYYLGCLFYDKKEWERSKTLWERAVKEQNDLSEGHRNLAILYYNKEQNMEKAVRSMKKALELEPDNSRMLLEYDQLLSKAGEAPEKRLARMEEKMDLVRERDVLCLEYITLLNNVGRYEESLSVIRGHRFHPWEGGEGKVSVQYRYALTMLAKQCVWEGRLLEAVELLEQTKVYPENLGEGKLPNVQDTIADYYLGCIYEEMGEKEKAEEHFCLASTGLEEPSGVLYYNDQPSDSIFYQGLANRKLGNTKAEKKCFHQLLTFGKKHLFDRVRYDYFAVSLPEIELFPTSVQTRNDLYCHYLMGLGHLGLGEWNEAKRELEFVLSKDPSYQGAICHRIILKNWEKVEKTDC